MRTESPCLLRTDGRCMAEDGPGAARLRSDLRFRRVHPL